MKKAVKPKRTQITEASSIRGRAKRLVRPPGVEIRWRPYPGCWIQLSAPVMNAFSGARLYRAGVAFLWRLADPRRGSSREKARLFLQTPVCDSARARALPCSHPPSFDMTYLSASDYPRFLAVLIPREYSVSVEFRKGQAQHAKSAHVHGERPQADTLKVAS